MNTDLLILTVALAVGLGVWGALRAAAQYMYGDRQKIQRRLIDDGVPGMSTDLARPITLQLEIKGVPRSLARLSAVQSLHRKLLYATPDARLPRFLALCTALGAVGFALVALLMDSLAAGLVGAVVSGYLPIMVLNSKAARRQRLLGLQLPDALDFLTRVLRAGHSLSTGLRLMGEELPKPIGAEFARCHDQHSLGHPLESCLKEAATRIDSREFAFFVTALLIQRQTGGDLAEVLSNISKMIRARVRLSQHVKAITAEGRFTGYILVAFPAILFAISFVLNPAYAGVLVRTDTGRYLLGGAFALQMIGLWVIRRIVTVKV